VLGNFTVNPLTVRSLALEALSVNICLVDPKKTGRRLRRRLWSWSINWLNLILGSLGWR